MLSLCLSSPLRKNHDVVIRSVCSTSDNQKVAFSAVLNKHWFCANTKIQPRFLKMRLQRKRTASPTKTYVRFQRIRYRCERPQSCDAFASRH